MKTVALISLFVVSTTIAFAQLRNTTNNGDWHQPSTWGGQSVPNYTFSTVTVAHHVVVRATAYPLSSPLEIDNLIIATGGHLEIESGAAVVIRNASGADVTISGSGQFTINGTLSTTANVSFAGLSSGNTAFTASAELRSSSVNLPIASGYDQITVYLVDFTNGLGLNSSWSQLTSGTDLIVNCPNLAGGLINFSGFLTDLNSLEIVDTDASNGGGVVFDYLGTSTLNIGAGGLTVTGDSRIFLTHAGTVTVNLSGDFVFATSASAQYSQSTSYTSGTINFNGGDFLFSSGVWNMASVGSNGVGRFRFNNDSDLIITGGLISENGSKSAQGILEFTGSMGNQIFSIAPTAIGPGTLNLTINKPVGNVVLTGGSLTVSDLTLSGGNLLNQQNSQTLTINGNFVSAGGSLDANIPMSVTIGGSGSMPAIIPFAPGSILASFTLNRAAASISLGNASIVDGGIITRVAGAFSNAISALGVYDIVYNNAGSMTTGPEIPATTTILRHLIKQGNGTLNFDRNATVNGNILLENGTGAVATSNFNVSVVGDFTAHQNFTMGSSSSLIFLTRAPSNVHSLSGTGATLAVGNLIVSGALTITRSIAIASNVNIQAASSILANAGTVSFTGISAVTNNGNGITFNNLDISGSFTGPASGTINITGNLSGLGTFAHNNGTVAFSGGGVSTISGASRLFRNISVANGKSVQSSINHSLAGDLVNDGVFTLSAGTLTKNGVGNFTGTGTTTVNNLNINSGINVVANGNLTVTGNLSFSGNFTSSATVIFNGTSALTGSGATSLTNVTVNTGRTLNISTNISIAGNITNNGTWSCSSGAVTLTGSNSQLTGTGNTSFFILTIASGQSLNAAGNVSINSSLVGVGGFSSTGTVTFNGNITVSGNGSKTFNNVIVSGGALTPNANMLINGNLSVVSGSLNAGNRTTTFGGTSNISGSNISFYNIVVNSGASIALPPTTITILNNFTNNGVVNAGNGTVQFSNSGVMKFIYGSSIIGFNNLSILNSTSSPDVRNENTAGVSVRGVLSISPGAVLDADGSTNTRVLTILSTGEQAGSDGSIGPLLGGASITGSVSVQRYISGIDNSHRYISTPVSNAPISQLQTSGIPITGNFTGTSYPCTGCDGNYYNLLWNNETAGGYIPAGDMPAPAVGNDVNELLVPGRGYDLYLWNGTNPAVWTARGQINSGDFSFNVTHTVSSPPRETEDGWNLVGNPYPSSIVWEDNADLPGGWTLSNNIYPVVYVWDVAGNEWRDYDMQSDIGSLDNGRIATGQGFWVYVTDSSPATLTIHEQAKSSASGTYYRKKSADPVDGIKVIASFDDGTRTMRDYAHLVSGRAIEVPKLEIGREPVSIGVQSSTKRLLYATLTNDPNPVPLTLKMNVREEGVVLISVESLGNYEISDDMMIYDAQENVTASARSGYTFKMSAFQGLMEGRFFLVKKSPVLGETSSVHIYPNPTTSGNVTIGGLSDAVQELTIFDNIGTKVGSYSFKSQRPNSVNVNLDSFAKGVYFIHVYYQNGGRQVHKLVKN